MRCSDFTFELPDELIARYPLAERSASRLLRLDAGVCHHGGFRDLPDLLSPGDLLVFNQSRVMPARLHARKATGGQVEILIERLPEPADGVWLAHAHVRASKSPKPGSELLLADGTRVVMRERAGDLFVLAAGEAWPGIMARLGEMPLPPYFGRAAEDSDRERYQTV
ncbi:MAG: S-adenosylmethionine:tRNA ribosyltransferase-isomerase, partial [Perlucidibaca sp.]